MSGKVLFACSKCFSKFYNFDELSSGQQLCKNCRGSTSIQKCSYCRSEFQPATKSQSACKKCEHNLNKYGKPKPCECCKIVAAFGSSKCMRCASYEARYGPPVQCDECKLRSAFDKHDENKKVNGKLLCWLCTCTFKRTLLKAQQDGRISTTKKRPHEKSHRDRDSSSAVKKSSRQSDMSKTVGGGGGGGGVVTSAVSSTGLELPDKLMRTAGGNSGNGAIVGLSSIANPTPTTTDPNSADHVVAVTNLKERIASLEKRLQQKDKELLEKDKLLTELKGKNFEKENEMRNKIKEIDRLHDMKVENMNRKVASLLKEIATLKKTNKKNTSKDSKDKEKEKMKEKRENISPKEEVMETDDKDSQDERDEKNSSSSSSRSNSPSTN